MPRPVLAFSGDISATIGDFQRISTDVGVSRRILIGVGVSQRISTSVEFSGVF
jgi:hypothetical protein